MVVVGVVGVGIAVGGVTGVEGGGRVVVVVVVDVASWVVEGSCSAVPVPDLALGEDVVGGWTSFAGQWEGKEAVVSGPGYVAGWRVLEEVVIGMAHHAAVEVGAVVADAVAVAPGEEVEAEEHRSERDLLWVIGVSAHQDRRIDLLAYRDGEAPEERRRMMVPETVGGAV